MLASRIVSAALILVLSSCTLHRTHNVDRSFDRHSPDQHSGARWTSVRVRHVSLDLSVDFEKRTLSGAATLDLDRANEHDALVLDIGEGLLPTKVTCIGQTIPHHTTENQPFVGRELRVQLPKGVSACTVHYTTTPDAKAVQWLEKEQTADGIAPYLFTQGQAILTRTWIPLQDSPGVRITYDATIRTPADLGVVAVMSAEQREAVTPGVTRFRMTHAIPPYLIALAIGRIEKRDISERCAVWAEPSLVEEAAREFEDTDDMLATCETIYGPYRWGRYDVLVLPPSFPFGGMENPCLTFATPTILAGDKSLVSLIAHELAHSWSGNLVTNATWRDFWLNEGFTVFVEQRIMEVLFGTERAAMETLHGLRGLEEEIASLPEADQILHVDLEGRDPDDGMTSIPYDKGAALLRRLEQVWGRERFDRFVQSWFNDHAFQSVTTGQFRAYLRKELLSEDATKAAAVDLDLWIERPGLPADCPKPDSDAFTRVDEQRDRWLKGAAAIELDTAGWVTMQWLHFLGEMPDEVEPVRLDDLDQAFAFTQSKNSEIHAKWLEWNQTATKGRPNVAVAQATRDFLLRVGRRKFLKPIYSAMAASEAGLATAREIYGDARPRYHSISSSTIDEILGLR